MSLKLFVSFFLWSISSFVFSMPTIGFYDRHQLETYEDLSDIPSDFDFFANLTFTFSCEGKSVGLYADQEYACRIFHVCDENGDDIPIICDNGTFFDQQQRICDWRQEIKCDRAHDWYYLNELPYRREISDEFGVQAIEDLPLTVATILQNEEVHSVLPLLTP
ncbi:uncharacterized protein LOC107270990 [Cephus cinctus]|uniref:Uncharacterized protein LOC107270990 n=1 Tax=Cephus cinctus TaxID=211228 RepID=A0AAJ7C5V8_CEPCN|nr:uncharacterized protein LOC107270990 [Cephus cinctus]